MIITIESPGILDAMKQVLLLQQSDCESGAGSRSWTSSD